MACYLKVQDKKVVLLNPKLNSIEEPACENVNPILEAEHDKKDQTAGA